jgi:hypothetical protein
MQNVSIFLEGSAADGSADQMLGSLTGSSSPSGVPSLLLGAADGTTALPAGGESAVSVRCRVTVMSFLLFVSLGLPASSLEAVEGTA